MTAEPWYPIPQDDVLEREAPDASPRDLEPPDWLTAGASPSSALVNPGAAAGTPTGALTFHCAACLLEWEEPFCDVCGANLTPNIDRPSHPSCQVQVRGAEGERF